MTPGQDELVTHVGAVLQFAGAVLLSVMCLLLRPYARRRLYFLTWSLAWLTLSAALGAQLLRIAVVPQVMEAWFILLLVAGSNQFVRGASQWRVLRWGLPLAVLYGVAIALWAPRGDAVLLAYAPVALLGYSWCAAQMGALPTSRQAIGSHLAGSVFAMLAIASLLDLLAFTDGRAHSVFRALLLYGSYLDLLLYVLLGYAMVLLLMEQAKREADAANAELAVAHSAMRRAALYDSLTGCLNRRAFDEGVGLENARGGYGAVMMFDLDDLKEVNDRYGHSAGDALLRHLTESLRQELRPSDKLYRWGGDEFLMLLPGADEARARARLRAVLADAAVLELGAEQTSFRLNVSMGSAAYASAEQISAAIDAADAMMYREKHRKKARGGS